MTFIIVLIAIIGVTAIVINVCKDKREYDKKKSEYYHECARLELIERQDRDINLDGEEQEERIPKNILRMRIKLRDKGYRTQDLNALSDAAVVKLYEEEYGK